MKATVPVLLLLCVLSLHLSAQTPKYSVANGEYANFILDNSTQTLYGVGAGAIGAGTNLGQTGLPVPCQFSTAGVKIKFAAAGLHTASAIDINGNVYFTGPNEDGTMGDGTTTGRSNLFTQIKTDINGNPFTDVTYLRMTSAIFTGGAGYGAIIFAVKGDGTLWVWGNTQGGYAGDGTYGQTYTRPKQINFPAGIKITKVMAGNIVIALDANGGVWTWAGNNSLDLLGTSKQPDYMTPHPVTLPSKAIDIAGAGFFSYALLDNHSLYGWGWYTGYMGVGKANGSGVVGLAPPKVPMLLDTSLNLPSKINRLSTNGTSTYVILTDGSLWAWGGNECGQIGNGQEIDYPRYTANPAPYGGSVPQPFNWNQDASTAQLQQHKPVNIAPGLNNFIDLSEGTAAVMYKFAIDANNQLYSWGRNKSGVLANGIMEGNYVNGGIISTYPNALDVPYLTAIDPFGNVAKGMKTIQTTCRWCLTNPTATSCALYAIPLNTAPSALINGGKTGTATITANNVSLDGTASTDNVYISYYVWTLVSGPSAPVISIPSGKKVNITGLQTGTYVFKLKVTDNGWMSDSTTYTVNVNTGGPQPPVASAGSDQYITLPANSVDLLGTASEIGGTILTTNWTQVSGPGTATFSTAGLLTTKASGLVQGVYVFQLAVKDLLGITITSTVKVTVLPAPIVAGPPSANAGIDQAITLPTNNLTLTGSGSETNGTIVSYAWTQTSGPSAASVGTANQASTAVSGLVQGVYTFLLTVKDNSNVVATDQVKVTVNAAPIVPGLPSANAGGDQVITLPTSNVTLTGSGSETNGTIASYAWTQTSGPNTAVLGTAGQASTGVSGLAQGVYTFQLTVKDNSNVTATDVVKVTVNSATPTPGTPVVDAGTNQVIALPTNSASLTATASETNGTIASYLWVELSGPNTAGISTSGQASTSVTGLIQGVYTFQITVKDNNGIPAIDVVKVTVNAAPIVPGAPSANAGGDQTITLPTNSLTLAGSGSETNGTIVSYVWSQVNGPSTATLEDATQALTVVDGLVQGVYTFKLTIKDNSGVTATDQVQVTVKAAPVVPGNPIADAGEDQTITLPINSVKLVGSGSEVNGNIASYLWVQLSGPAVANVVSPNVSTSVVSNLVAGVYTFQLTVKDVPGIAGLDQVQVTVLPAPPNKAPLANAGPDQTVNTSATSVTLDGSASYDPDGSIAKYQWIQLSGLGGVTITNAGASKPSVYGMNAGTYTFQLTVTDDEGSTGVDQVKVTMADDAANTVKVVANAGSDTAIAFPASTAMLDGSNSSATGSTIASYSWKQLSGPSASQISTPTSAQSEVAQLETGLYVYELTVTDDKGNTDVSNVQVRVIFGHRSDKDVLHIYPNPFLGTTINLEGSNEWIGKAVVKLFDIRGGQVMTYEFNKTLTDFTQQVPVPAGLNRGVYLLSVYFTGQTGRPRTYMIIKQ